jgi:polyhydroxyalkanoate synthesis regulator phasin
MEETTRRIWWRWGRGKTSKLRKTMMKGTELTPEQAKICMKHMVKTFKEKVGEEARRIAKKVVKNEEELGKYRRSFKTTH